MRVLDNPITPRFIRVTDVSFEDKDITNLYVSKPYQPMYNKGNVVVHLLLAYLDIDSSFAGTTVAVYSCKQTII